MTWHFILPAIAAAVASAQITVSTVDSKGVETSVANLYDTGQAHPGDFVDTRFRLRNTAQATVTLQVLRISGTGFSLIGYPPLPYLMAPGTNVDFRVRFQPMGFGSYSAPLAVNERTILVTGSAPQGVTVLAALNGQAQPISASTPLTLGRVEKGQTAAYPFLLRNDTAAPLQVEQVSLTGADFRGPTGLVLPARLDPGGSASFEISFAPPRSGTYTAQLTVDGRTFPLEAVSFDPPLPEATLSVTPALTSGMQGKLSIRFPEAVHSSTTAIVKLAFASAIPGVIDDPAIVLLANNSRTAQVLIREGDTAAPDTIFQTGSTAGTLTFTVQVGLQTLQALVTIAPAPPLIAAVAASRNLNSVEVDLSGFDNTRSASAVAFTFYDRNGHTLNAEPVRTDISSAFAQYFKQSAVGGLFLLRAVFPVYGDPAQISAVDVELTSSGGVTRPTRTVF